MHELNVSSTLQVYMLNFKKEKKKENSNMHADFELY